MAILVLVMPILDQMRVPDHKELVVWSRRRVKEIMPISSMDRSEEEDRDQPVVLADRMQDHPVEVSEDETQIFNAFYISYIFLIF